MERLIYSYAVFLNQFSGLTLKYCTKMVFPHINEQVNGRLGALGPS